jgi:hypothetical protein
MKQSHIEKHLIQTEQFQKLQSHISYRLQEWLQLSQILFPVSPVKNTEGKIMQSFDHLNQRIQLGLSLYVLLFDKKNLPSVYRFACKKEHTGSRSDYDPTVFSTSKMVNMGSPKEKLSFFKTKKNRTLYSPKLNDVWYKNYTGPFYPSDWFNGQRIFSQIRLVSDSSPKIWRAYWAALHQIESAFLLKHFYLLIKKNRSLKERRLFK